jgi:DoxX-like family
MSKSTRIISIVLLAIPSVILVLSAIGKLSANKNVVQTFGKTGLRDYIAILGVTELLLVVLLWIPKTRNIGFFLACSYLGGAMSFELSAGHFPSSSIFLIVIWIAVYLRDKQLFVSPGSRSAT